MERVSLDQMELFPLTPDELHTRSKSLAGVLLRYNLIEAESKVVTKRYRDDMKELRAQMTQLSETVIHESEWRAHIPPWQDSADEDEDR